MKLLFTFSLLCMSALTYAQTGNTVIGQNADSKLNPGDFTLAYNGSAAHGLILSDRNSPIGYIAGGYLTASELRVIEPEKGFSNIKGDKNTLMGHSAGMSSTTGNDGLSSAGVAIYAAPDINIKENGVNIRSGGSVNFGNVELTGASKIKTFTLENLGDEVLEVVPSSSGIYAEYYDGDFTLNFPNEYHVEPSESITFQITFDPTFYGTTSAIAVIVNNSPREAPYDIYLRGTGTCTPVSNTGQLLTWTGAKNTTWNDVCNWSPMLVPTANNDVTIPSAPANQPTLSVNNAVAKSVEVLSGATFTIGTNGQLTINNSKSFTVSTDTRTSAFLNLGTVVNNGKIILGSATFIGEHGFWNNGTFNNNTGGEISIDNSTRNGLYNRSGTFTNAAKISIGANGSVGFNGLENQAIFNNNAGGEINIDGSSSNGLDNVSGTFNNAAKIIIEANTDVGINGLENQAIFNNNAGGEINIDGSSIKGLRNTLGTFSNAAKITIGANASIGSEGLENQAIFNNNTGGELRIDRSLTKGLHNYSGTFTNAAKIIIGANANVGFNGLENRATFKNNIGGEINIDRTNQNGLFNRLGTFTNAAKITIGRNASGGDDGLQNRATFNNNMGGELSIDNSTFNGLYNYSGTFTNVAKITIGANASGGHNGLGNQAFFNNNTGGEINIDRSSQKGIYNYGNGGTFNNTGLLTLGANAGVGLDAIYNEATFNNNVCGEVVVHRAIINNTSMNTYTNTGLTYLASELKNDGTFTNYGVLKYGSTTGNAISNATASSIIVKDNPTPIFTYGGTYDGTINGIYTDTTATTTAGTFSTPNNFIPNNSLPAGLQTLYASITQSGCSTAGILPFTYNSVPEINLKGNEVTIANGASSPAVSDSTDFGTISVSTGSNSNTFYIINDGTGTLTLDATPVSIAGIHSVDFSVTQPSFLSIAVGDSVAFQITFDPSASGVREANVSIANNDSDENPYTFAISGTGTDICTPVTNTGQRLTWTGAKNTTWNDACNWSPTLVPTATNDVVIPNTTIKPTINVNNGVAKTVQVQRSARLTISTSGQLTVNGSRNFLGIQTGFGNIGTIENSGRLVIGNISSAGEAAIYNAGTFNNNVGGELTVNRGSFYGIYNTGSITNRGKITIESTLVRSLVNNHGSFTNNLCGSLLIPVGGLLHVGPAGFSNNGYLLVGKTLEINDNLINNGVLKYKNLTGSGSLVNAQNASVIVNDNPTPIFTYGGTFDGTVNGIFINDSVTTAGTFTAPNSFIPSSSLPTGLQTLYASITQSGCSTAGIFPFTYNSVPEINLKGNGVTIANGASSPAASDSTDFGTISVSSGSNSNTFYIINDGTGVLTLGATPVSIAGTHSSDFSVTQPSSLSIAVGDSIAFQITFDPSASGVREATVSIANNDSDESPYTFAIQGLGLCDSGSAPTASISGTANLTCSVTSVTRTASGGTSYSWSNSLGTNATANITSPGTYTVTVAAANGCTATATTEVTQDATVPTPSISGTNNLSCAITSVTRTASGGVSYSWSGPSSYAATTAEATINTPGTYTVTVTGSNGCTATATTAVTQDASVPTPSISGIDNLSCAITSVTRTASGGVSYSWSGPSSYAATTAEATINTPGTYTVTVTGSNGCTATATTAVTQDASVPTPSISGTNNLSCAITSVTRTASGGVSYSWSGPNSYVSATAEATINIPGTYTVTVTASNGCTATATTAVTQDATVPTASISGTDNLSCAVTSVTRTASGGASYSWSGPSSYTSATAEATINTPGTYTVTVTASNGCTATATTTVTQDATAPTASISGTDNLSCAVISVTRTASGGASYSWSGPNSYSAATAEATINTPGTYTVTVTGSNGCTATATTAVTQDATVPTASISGTDNLSCAVTSVTRTASGGASYSWSGPSSYAAATAEATINTPGTYTVTVTGSNGCTATATTAVTQDATVPTASISGTDNLSCAITSVTRTASGGVSYSWSGPSSYAAATAEATINTPGTYTVTVTGSNGCTATATTAVTQDATVPTASISGTDNLSCAITSVTRTASGGVSYSWSGPNSYAAATAEATINTPGTYTVTVTGSNGCTATATTAVTQDATVPTASISGTDNLSCAITSVTRTASGGVSYSWSGPSSYAAATAEATINTPGTYTVTVTGSNGCTATATTEVTQDATVPTASISGTDNLSCAITSVTRTASGGVSYSWSGPNSYAAATPEATINTPGTYTVTVTGSNGCTATATTEVTLDDTVPSLSITGSDSLNCSVNSVTRTALGTGTYQWSNGLGPNATANITVAGTYTVTLTAANGCTNTSTTTVVFDNNLVVTASNDGPYEEGEAINLMATGGPSYTWTGPNGFASSIVNPSIPNATSAKSGIYTVTVNNGSCTGTATTNVVVACSTPGMSYYLAYTDGAEPEVFSPLVENLKVQVSNRPMTILAVANCELPMVESARIHISGNGNNHYYVDNAAPYSLYELNGAITGEEQEANFYTFQFTGYNQANAQGDTVVGRDEIQYSIVHGNRAISLPTLSTSSLCAGTSLTVSGTESGNFPFYEGNVFQAFLSDENGNFGNQILIGSSSDLNSIVCTIPNNLPSGDNYKVVIRSSSPIVSSLASANLSIISASVTLLSPTNDILNGTRTEKATQTINAQNQIEGNSNVVYKAGNAVMLEPGFKAESGTVFSAKIEDVCVE